MVVTKDDTAPAFQSGSVPVLATGRVVGLAGNFVRRGGKVSGSMGKIVRAPAEALGRERPTRRYEAESCGSEREERWITSAEGVSL